MTIEEIKEKYRSDLELLIINPDLVSKKYWKECVVIQTLLSRIKELEKESIENLEVWKAQQKHANYLSSHIEVLEERIKELETELAKIKSDPNIGKLIVEEWPESPDY